MTFLVYYLLLLDSECVLMIGKSRGETLQRLRANVESQLNQVNTTVTTNLNVTIETTRIHMESVKESACQLRKKL